MFRCALSAALLVVLSCPATASAAPRNAASQTKHRPRNAVTLITGDRILFDGDRPGMLVRATSHGLGGVLLTVGLGGRSYEIPASALPYLGRGLDLGLFDVAQPRSDRARVHVTYQAKRPDLPGVTWTGPTDGYLTAGSARVFGAALARRPTGLLDGVEISRPGTPLPPVRPQYQMRTLTLHGVNAAGKPAQYDEAILLNLDDSNRFGMDESAFRVFDQGEARFSVPQGRYSLLSYFFTVDAQQNVTSVRLVANSEFTVQGDTKLTVDARTANSKVTMVTPRPAVEQGTDFGILRVPAHGPKLYIQAGTQPGVSLLVSPTRRVSVGQLFSAPFQRLVSADGTYAYCLTFDTAGFVPRQRYQVRGSALATVDASYYSDVPSHGFRQISVDLPWDADQMVLHEGLPMDLPVRRTEYVTGDPRMLWYGGFAKWLPNLGIAWSGGNYDLGERFTAGQQVQTAWNRYPLHPTGVTDLNHPWPFEPPAVRGGNTLTLNLQPFADNTVGHTGWYFYEYAPDQASGTYNLFQDGVKVAGGDANTSRGEFRVRVPLQASPSSVRLVLDTSRTGPHYVLSTQTHTEWTWRSQHVGGTRLPYPNWTCWLQRRSEPERDCAVEPMMAVHYQVAGMDLTGRVPTGPGRLELFASHVQGARSTQVTGATVEVSTDGGTTWRSAQVSGTAGHYVASYDNPAGGFVSLRVTATDTAGGKITETIQRAYAAGRTR